MLDKIVFLGHAMAGKTSLIQQFTERTYRRTYSPTTEGFYTQVMKYPDGLFQAVEIIDTFGGDEFPAMRSLRITQGTMFIIVYALDDLESFHKTFNFFNMIKTCRKNVIVPILIAANKLDRAEKRIVTSEMALDMARRLNCPHVEVSARWNLNVTSMFDMILSLKCAVKKENTKPGTEETKTSFQVPRPRFDCFPKDRRSPDQSHFPIQRSNTFHGISEAAMTKRKDKLQAKGSFRF